MQDRKRISLPIQCRPVKHLKSHMLVEPCSLGILLIHVHLVYIQCFKNPGNQLSADALPHRLRGYEQHLNLMILHPYEAQRLLLFIGEHKQMADFPESFKNHRPKSSDILFGEKMMGKAYRCFPNVQ